MIWVATLFGCPEGGTANPPLDTDTWDTDTDSGAIDTDSGDTDTDFGDTDPVDTDVPVSGGLVGLVDGRVGAPTTFGGDLAVTDVGVALYAGGTLVFEPASGTPVTIGNLLPNTARVDATPTGLVILGSASDAPAVELLDGSGAAVRRGSVGSTIGAFRQVVGLPSGGTLLVGDRTNGQYPDLLIVQLDAAGNFVRGASYGEMSVQDRVTGAALMTDGRVAISGSTAYRPMLATYDPADGSLSATTVTNASFGSFEGVAAASSGVDVVGLLPDGIGLFRFDGGAIDSAQRIATASAPGSLELASYDGGLAFFGDFADTSSFLIVTNGAAAVQSQVPDTTFFASDGSGATLFALGSDGTSSEVFAFAPAPANGVGLAGSTCAPGATDTALTVSTIAAPTLETVVLPATPVTTYTVGTTTATASPTTLTRECEGP